MTKHLINILGFILLLIALVLMGIGLVFMFVAGGFEIVADWLYHD
jgi:hypothetical protein